MKNFLRLAFTALLLAGTLTAVAYPKANANLTGDGSGPIPTCWPLDPKCPPPIPPPGSPTPVPTLPSE